MRSMNGRWRGREPDGGGGDRYRGTDASSPQDLIVEEPWLSRPLPGSACLARWAAVLRSGRSQMTASLRRYLRPGRRGAAIAALLAAVTVAALVAAPQPTTQAARASAPPGNVISNEARLSQEVAMTDCAALARLHLADVTVDLAQADTSGSFTIPPGQQGAGTVLTGLPALCDVRLTQDSPPAADQVHVEVWLPLVAWIWLPRAAWNGRFQGVGGGRYSCGISYSALVQALQGGYATASTDCGRSVSGDNGRFALGSARTLNWPLITDFASRGIHMMSVDGKAVTTAFYGTGPS